VTSGPLPLTSHLDGEIRHGRHHMQVRVYYEDTDFCGTVCYDNTEQLGQSCFLGPMDDRMGDENNVSFENVPNMRKPHLDGEIRDGDHHMQVRVYYEDTDFSGLVYHANYLRFMERARTNYLRLLGTDHRSLFEETEIEAPGFAFVVRHMEIDFFKPAHMDDVLEIITAPQEVKGASITLLQRCRRGADLLVEARVRVAFVSGGKAQRIPKSLRLAMAHGLPG
jgi:acyl-CoA thioester hydrolase